MTAATVKKTTAKVEQGPLRLRFNALLKLHNLDLKGVRLVRHKDNRYGKQASAYEAWLADDGRLESYQRVQGNPEFHGARYLASFVATPQDETLFIGLYEVGPNVGVVPAGTRDRLTGEDVSGCHLYDIERSDLLSEYRGRVIVEWGKGYRSWVQHAANQDKVILEIRRAAAEPPFPGFLAFSSRLSGIATLPATWRAALSSVGGVYLLADSVTGGRYVGSAYGQGGFWGRWDDYVRNGHGGNIGLKALPRADYQVSILEVAASSASNDDIFAMEARWKTKLLTRQFGLNQN